MHRFDVSTRIAFAVTSAPAAPWAEPPLCPAPPACSAWRTLATRVRRRRQKPLTTSWARRSAAASGSTPDGLEDPPSEGRCGVGMNDARGLCCGETAGGEGAEGAEGFAYR